MKSISRHLLLRVMSVYLVLTLGIFAFEVTLQYRTARDGITAELDMLQATFHDSISYALWNLDANALNATVSGMLKMPSVTRVVARESNGHIAAEMTAQDEGRQDSLLPSTPYGSRQRITHREGKRPVELGWLEIESNSNVIVHRMKAGVLVAFIAAVIKTLLLVILVQWFFGRILSRPLLGIAQAAAAIDPKAVGPEPLKVKPGDPDELDVISAAINGLAAEVGRTVGALDALNKGLESQVEQRTAALREANRELGESLAQLRSAQASLVESEKMAALGALVAGIAHEINTPVGLGLTGSSHFKYMVEQLEAKFRAGELEEPDFERFLADSNELARSIYVSLEKAAALVRSFKLVAVDQGNDELREFNVAAYLADVARTYHPVLRKAHARFGLECDERLSVHSHPGAWSQILSNLINNSVQHGFDEGQADARIDVTVHESDEHVTLVYSDNGRGMSDAVARKVFDPFFTTNRKGGGSGLGMHIVYNLVAQQLQGRIQLATQPGRGVTFTIRLPRQLRESSATPAAAVAA